MEDQLCQVLTACRRSRFLLTYTVPNELKLHIGVHKSLFYKNLVPDNVISDVLGIK